MVETKLRLRLLQAIGLAGIIAAGTVHSHHTSAAVFSTDDIEIEGLVTEFNFKNPHLNIILAVTDENGVETQWMATGPGPTPFRRWGWTPDTVQPGQYLRIFGRKSRDGGPMVLMDAADIHGGRIVELDPADGSIVRTISSTSTVSRPSREATTATTIRPLRITQHDDRLVLEYEEFAARRVIYLDGRGPESNEHTLFGHHMARYEGDALIIETTQLLGNLSGPLGNALSDRATTVETYRRVDDPASGPAIELRMVITDPGNLTRAWEIGTIKYYTAEPYDFVEVDCRLPFLASGQR